MARQEVDIGIEGNDGTGDSIRESFKKVNDNFQELYAVFGLGGALGFASLSDTPDTYVGNESSVPLVKTDGTGISFYKFVSDRDDNSDDRSDKTNVNSILVEFLDPDPAFPDTSGTLKIVINDAKINTDPDPNLTAPLNAEAAMAYSNTVNAALRNRGTGDDINTLTNEWNAVHSGADTITPDNVVISKGYADDTYVNISGDTMIGPLAVPSGATGSQAPQAREVITRAGSVENRSMLDDLFLADHPSPLSGRGIPRGSDDLLAVSKLYVDTQSFSTTNNIYVSTDGDDNQTYTPPGKEGRGPAYAYRTIGAAMQQAERIIEATPFEPGPYIQTVTYGNAEGNSYIDTSTGFITPVTDADVAAGIVDTNISDIQEGVLTYIRDNVEAASSYSPTIWAGFTYDDAKCQRDVQLLLEAIRYDFLFNSNYRTINAAKRYLSGSASAVQDFQKDQTLLALQQSRTLTLNALTNGTVISRAASLWDEVLDIIANGTKAVDAYVYPTPLAGTNNAFNADILAARDQLIANKAFLVAEVTAWIAVQVAAGTPPFTTDYDYNEAKCARDVGLIIDNMIYDVTYGGNMETWNAAQAYFVGAVAQYGYGEKAGTVAALGHLKTVIESVVQEIAVTPSAGNPEAQDTSGTASTAGVATNIGNLLQELIDYVDSDGVTTPTLTYPETAWTSIAYQVDFNLLDAALRLSIAEDTTDWIDEQIAAVGTPSIWYDFSYNEELCIRDVKLILDAIKLDVQSGATANYLTRYAGLRYNASPSSSIAKSAQKPQTIAAIREAQRLITDLLDDAVTAGTITNASIPGYYDDRFDDIVDVINDVDVLLTQGSNYRFDIFNGGFSAVDQGLVSNLDLREGKLIVGQTSGAKGIITSFTRSATGTTDRIDVDLVEPIEFIPGEELSFGNLTRSNQITVRVETGIYEEHLPIKLPENVSIKGDEFRRVVVRPKKGVSQSPWANTYFYRDIIIDNLITVYSPVTEIDTSGVAADAARVAGTYSVTTGNYVTDGHGTGATFEVVIDGAGAVTVTITEGGTGFILDERITIPDEVVGGSGAAADIIFSVSNVGGGYHSRHPITDKQGKYGYHYLTDPSIPVEVGTDGVTNPGGFSDAARLVQLNRAFIIEEVIQYISATYPTLVYNEATCRRDTGLIVDALVTDLKTGGREQALKAQGSYFKGRVQRIPDSQKAETADSIAYIKTIAADVLANTGFTALGTVDQVIEQTYTAETNALTNLEGLVDCVVFAFDPSYNPPLENKEMDVFLCNDGTIVRNITVQQHGGFMMVLDPEGQILTRSPYCQTGSSFSQSKVTERSFAGGQFVDGYAGNMPVTITNVVDPFTLDVESPAGQGLFVRRPPTPFPFWVAGSRYQVNTITNYDQTTGTARLILDETSNASGSVTRNITAITNANPAQVTTSDLHGFTTGDSITITSVSGMTELNGRTFTVTVIDTLNFTLDSEDSTLYNTYSSGGFAETIAAGGGWSSGVGTPTNDPVTDGFNRTGDVFVQSGGNRSMLANDFTQVNDLGFGTVCVNNALAELVSMFTYYCHTGYLADSGSQIRSIAGNNSYGFYGLVAAGSDPDERSTDVTLNAKMTFAGKTWQASHRLTFASAVPAGANIGDEITQATTGATGTISFKAEGDTVVYLTGVTGTFNTSDAVTADGGATALGTPSGFETLNTSANIADLFLYAYDLDGLPNNVSEVEILHTSGLYQPYELTNASLAKIGGKNFIFNSYEIGDAVAFKSTAGGGTGLVVTVAKNRTDGYVIVDFEGGTSYTTSSTVTISGADLGGLDVTNDLTIAVDAVTSGVPTALSISGTPTAAYDDSTPVLNGQVWRFNFGTGIEGTSENGLQEATLHDTPLVIRHKQNFVFDGVTSLPTRPSTAVEFVDDTDEFTYRTIGFTTTITDGYAVGNNQSVITFDANFRYIDMLVEQDIVDAGITETLVSVSSPTTPRIDVNPGFTDIITAATPSAKTLGYTAGDRFIAISKLDATDTARIQGAEMVFTWGGKTHLVEAYSEYTYTPTAGADIEFGVIQISDISGTDVNYPATASGIAVTLDSSQGISLKGGLNSTEEAAITVNISTCRATGHDMLDIGTGGYNTANYPERIFGSPVSDPVSTNDAIDSTGNRSAAQVQERTRGRVFTVMTDQDGFFRVGRFFTVDQGTGSVTFNAALVLTNIDGIGFKRGVRVNEFSNDDTFTDAKGDAVPTQTAVDNYINFRLGFDRDGQLVGSSRIGPGVMSLGGPGSDQTPMEGNMNLNNFKIQNLATPTSGLEAANKNYVDTQVQAYDELSELLDTAISGSLATSDILIWNGTTWEDGTISGDVTLSRSGANTITSAITAGSIVNADVSTTAAVDQSKLNMTIASATASAPTGTAAQIQAASGLASFDSANFEITDGWVGIKAQGVSATELNNTLDLSGKTVTLASGEISNGELANSSITIGTTSVSLGSTITALTGISTINHTGNITGPANTSGTAAGNNNVSIGSSLNRYNTIWAEIFNGTATTARYADLAENYLGDAAYEPGTVLVFGGEHEVTVCNAKGQTSVAGVVTTNPAHLMNSMLKGEHVVGVALTGRVPCKVIGTVKKGDMLVTSAVPGYAIVNNDPKVGTVIGKAVTTKNTEDRGIVEVVVGRV